MAGLKRYTSNRQEILAARLAECIRTPLSSPLKEEIIIVQSKGMERWLCMELARRQGICANVRFPFPNAFLDDLCRTLLPECRETPVHEPEAMAWKILRLLPACLSRPEFSELRRYLQEDAGGLKGYQLAGRLADLFDQYLVFRPDMILKWESGDAGCDGDGWQAELWRLLQQDVLGDHRARLRGQLRERLRAPLPSPSPLPERVCVFGISWLPPFHLEILLDLSRHLDLHLFLLNPCREFWTDVRSEREMAWTVAKARQRSGQETLSAEDLYLESGNNLLASMGQQGRDFFCRLMDLPGGDAEWYADPGEASLLQALQSDILTLRERGENGGEKSAVDPLDRSLEIHSCHSPMREVEVLHDQLLALFDGNPDLLPRDILVMAPDMSLYAPLIQAVFDTPPAASPEHGLVPRIPFAITDRRPGAESQTIDAFLSLLDLLGSRFEASRVSALLESPSVRRKFDLSEDDMERIRRWIGGARIRWGIDGEARRRAGLPGGSENTWRAGLDRLFLGYALPANEERLFNGILPYDDIEGLEAQTLGPLAEYLESLFSAAAAIERPKAPADWADALLSQLERFFHDDEETQRDLLAIRQVLLRLAWLAEQSGFTSPVAFDVIQAYLRRHFDEQSMTAGFMSGGINCCAMLPMRSLPFKVICLLGMNHDAYPRSTRAPGFDLIARHPRPGDRSRRADDRYLFLEALLSAREKLIISYVGQSIADNTHLPPSVVVSELLDAVEKGFRHPMGKVTEAIVTHHHLQAFHPDYFSKGSKLFSYSEENRRAAQCLKEIPGEAPSFFPIPLPEPDEDDKTIDIGDLIFFFRNPCRFLLERHLSASLGEDRDELADREAFDLRGLEKYDLEQRLVEKALAGQRPGELFPLFRASGCLPHGNVGLNWYEGLIREVEDFSDDVKPYLTGEPLEPLEVHLDLAGFRITGRIDNRYRNGLFQYRYAALKAKDHLRLWISHLLLNRCSNGESGLTATLIGRNGAWQYRSIENAEAILEELLMIYLKGMTIPINFFPDTALTYAEQVLINEKNPPEALRSAGNVWRGSEFARGESDDRYYKRCFQSIDPLDQAFRELSLRVFRPLIEHRAAL